MSELNEIEATLNTAEVLKPQENLSPTSINTYFKCPRSYFYNYIYKIKTKPNIHLIKGGIVHKVLEDFYKEFEEDTETRLMKLLEMTWLNYEQRLKDLELPPEELETSKTDIKNMLLEYNITITRKMNSLLQIGKAENRQHAWFLLRPKFREKYVKDEELHCVGYIDRIHEDYDGNITLGDYKTSSKFGIGLPEDYKRQLALYSLLYKTKEKKTPNFVAVIFLRYGEEYILEVTPSLLRYARDTIVDTYPKTRTTSIDDYPKKEGSLCRWCDYCGICDGSEEFDKDIRIEKLTQKVKKNGKKEVKI